MENSWKKCILLTMIEKTQDKQVLVCNFNPHRRQKVNALLIQNKHTKLFYDQFYIHLSISRYR